MSDSIMDAAEIVQNEAENYDYCLGARIKVIGVGGGGGNAVQHMINSGLPGVQFISANTDRQALDRNSAELKIQLGENLTKGRGAGANPKVGREAAMESINAIRDAIGDSEMLFVTAGMGGGTGTGGASVVAQVAREMNVLTVAVVTKPFSFEGSRRCQVAEDGLTELKQYVDCLITIPNDRLIGLAPKKAAFEDMLQRSNEVLYHAVKGITDVVKGDGLINLDFADVRTTMSEAGLALMGSGVGSGENRAREAAQRAISSPLLEDVSLDSAKAILYNITASHDIAISEVDEIGKMIHDAAPGDCNIIFGVVFDDNIGENISVTIIATGIEAQENVLPIDNQVKTIQFQDRDQRGRRIEQPSMPSDADQSYAREPYRRKSYESRTQQRNPNMSDELNYGAQNSFTRRNRQQNQDNGTVFVFSDENSDVPAFIRRQAD
ncbi:MAG: cell division protein FtsZ [Desulfovibrionaceae bacterium]|nr:cell division protein FtsZ [Desulfovibrionaceae bacterium]